MVIGQKFGDWTVIETQMVRRKDKNGSRRFVKVRCSCGIEKECCIDNLQKGKSLRCRECATKKILVGKKFGKLLAIKQEMKEQKGRIRSYHLCRCDCGKERWVLTQSLHLGHTKTCGDPTTCAIYGQKADPESHLRSRYSHYKKGASSRNYSFDLTYEEFKHLVLQNCWYCGSAPVIRNRVSYRTGRNKLMIPNNGIDRVDNSQGYNVLNSVACCSACNRAKNTMTKQEFIDLANAIAKKHPN